jgi:conjugal transfer mating pair stabilization protein TraN
MKEKNKKIIVISVIVVFVIGIILVIINRDKIPFIKLMSNSIADLTSQYSCEEGYVQNGTECTKEEEIEATVNRNCEAGYSEINGGCEKEETIDATYQANCEAGYTYDAGSGQCVMKEEATADVISNCPGGYTREGNTCVKRSKATCEFLRYDCPGKGTYDTGSNSVYKGLCGYSKCPNGYDSSGGKCYKVQKNDGVFGGSWVHSVDATKDFSNHTKCSKGVFMHTGAVSLADLMKEFPSGGNFKKYYNEGYRYTRGEMCRTKKVETKNIEKCSDGYKTAIPGACVKEPTKIYICGNGYVSNGDGTGTKTETAEPTVLHICGNGYNYNAATNKCERVQTKAPTSTPGYVCGEGYTLSGNKCIKKSNKTVNVTYTCPSGYNLEGTKCKRTITKEGIKG